MPHSATALAKAEDYFTFLAAARRIVEASSEITLHLDRIDPLVEHAKGWDFPDWSFHLAEPRETSIARGVMEFVSNAALNGGYFEMREDGIAKWEADGSGSKALLEWIATMRELGLWPGDDLLGARAARSALAPHVARLPFAAERLEILSELADPARRQRVVDDLVGSSDAVGAWIFGVPQARLLARAFPAGFGGDPFMKKACLALLMIAGWLHHAKGRKVICQLPIPADYQIPRILAWKGVIEVSDGFAAEIKNEGKLLDVESPGVTAMRAAAIVAAHEIGRRAGKPDVVVDGALFIPFRRDPDFIAFDLPPMRCASMWF